MNGDDIGIRTKLIPNKFVPPTLKARGPRPGARDPGSPGEPGAFHLFGLGQVTPATSPVTQINHPPPTEPQQRYKQDVGACSIADSAVTLGSRSSGLGKMVQEPWARFHVAKGRCQKWELDSH